MAPLSQSRYITGQLQHKGRENALLSLQIPFFNGFRPIGVSSCENADFVVKLIM
jgi:hypothetical protein